MSLEEQNHSVGRFISLLYRYGSMFTQDRLHHLGIVKGLYPYLNALYKVDGITQEQLSDYLKIDKGTTAKALKKLEAQGYIRRIKCEDDKRCMRVFLSDRGWDAKPEIRQALLEWRHLLTEGFTEEEKQQVLKLLERMGHNAATYAPRVGKDSDEADTGSEDDDATQAEVTS